MSIGVNCEADAELSMFGYWLPTESAQHLKTHGESVCKHCVSSRGHRGRLDLIPQQTISQSRLHRLPSERNKPNPLPHRLPSHWRSCVADNKQLYLIMEERSMPQREKVKVQEVGQRATPRVVLQHRGWESQKMKRQRSGERGSKEKGKDPKAELPKENWHSRWETGTVISGTQKS